MTLLDQGSGGEEQDQHRQSYSSARNRRAIHLPLDPTLEAGELPLAGVTEPSALCAVEWQVRVHVLLVRL